MGQDSINIHASFIWQIANLLRGDFKQSEYGKIVLPLTILRRLDCVLAPTKEAVLAMAKSIPEDTDDEACMMLLGGAAGAGGQIYNTSRFTFESLRHQDEGELRENLVDYITGFSPNVRDIFLEKFNLTEILKKLDDAGSLWLIFDRFCQAELHPSVISNLEMGYLFEELIRKFSEMSNETAGEHFTPREVVQLVVDLLIGVDDEALTGKGVIRRVYDPTCGTGGMLSIAEETMHALNPDLKVDLFGQELNGESYAICTSDMMVKGHDVSQIAFGNTLTDDKHEGETFHYMMSNPPYGVDWKKFKSTITDEAERLGFDGRFGAGLPRVSDGQLLFVQHMVSKMRKDDQGSRIGIVMNGSPMFTGGAGSGESEIRRWLFEQDLVEAIVALPTDLFYNTGIQTYIWILSNKKSDERKGKVQIIDASGERFWSAMRKSLGSKRREITDEARAEIVQIYGGFLNGDAGYGDVSKIMDVTDFGYREIRVERPLKLRFDMSKERVSRLFEEAPNFNGTPDLTVSGEAKAFFKNLDDSGFGFLLVWAFTNSGKAWNDRSEFLAALEAEAKILEYKLSKSIVSKIISFFGEADENAVVCRDAKGNKEPDPKLRDHELVPLGEDYKEFFKREVEPFVPDAWVDEGYTDAIDGGVGRVGYEINFNRYFYQYVPPRPLAEIDAELKELEVEIAKLLSEVVS